MRVLAAAALLLLAGLLVLVLVRKDSVAQGATATFTVDSPAPGLVTRASEIEVVGTVHGWPEVTVDGRPAAIEGERFRARVPLEVGANTIEAKAWNRDLEITQTLTFPVQREPAPR